jgi:hypothetical protein
MTGMGAILPLLRSFNTEEYVLDRRLRDRVR